MMNRLVIFYIILLSSIISYVDSYTFINITPTKQNDKYASVSSMTCVFIYDILIKKEKEFSSTTFITNINPGGSIQYLQEYDDTIYYKIMVSVDQGNGSITLSITEDSDLVPSFESINYFCEGPPNEVNVQLRSTSFYFPYIGNQKCDPYLFIEIPSFNKSQAPLLVASIDGPSDAPFTTFSNGIFIESFGGNIYKLSLSFSPLLDWSDINNNISFTLSYREDIFSSIIYRSPPINSFFKNYDLDIASNTKNIFYPLRKDSIVDGDILYNLIEFNKTTDQSLFIMMSEMRGLNSIAIYPLLVKQNHTSENFIQNTYIIIYKDVNIFTPLSFLIRFYNGMKLSSLSDTIIFDKPYYQTLNSFVKSCKFDQFTNVISTTIDTNMTLGFIIQSNIMFIDEISPLYLGQGNSLNYSIETNIFTLPFKTSYSFYCFNGADEIDTITQQLISNRRISLLDNLYPNINYIKVLTIENYLIIQMNITDDLSGFHSVKELGSYRDIVSGDLNNGVYEFIIDLNSQPYLFDIFTIYDRVLNHDHILLSNYQQINFEKIQYFLDLDLISNITFEYQELDVSNQSLSNTMYIYYPSEFKNWKPQIFSNNSITRLKDTFIYGQYDESISAFKFIIDIHKNYISGEYFFQFISNENKLIDSHYLKFLFGSYSSFNIKSKQGDNFGPVINKLQTLPGIRSTILSGVNTNITWRFTIEDSVNGFRNGTIVIQSSLDFVKYIFEISPESIHFKSGDKYIGIYELNIQVNGKCKSQEFYVRSIILQDEYEYTSKYDKRTPHISSNTRILTSPLMFLSSEEYILPSFSSSLSIYTTCLFSEEEQEEEGVKEDINLPKLVSFDFYPKKIDTTYSGMLNETSPRLVIFDFETFDRTGIMLNALPKIYLYDIGFDPISKESVLVSYNETNAKYQCRFEIPYAFGFPNGIHVSLYGIVDNQSNFKGYPISSLNASIVVSQTINQNTSILSTSELKTTSTSLTIFGKQFNCNDKSNRVLIQDNEMNIIQTISSPIECTNSLMVVRNISATIKSAYVYITVQRNNNNQSTIYSNSFKVLIKDYTHPSSEEPYSSSSSSSDSSDSQNSGSTFFSSENSASHETILPTNSPQPCLNLCSNNGYCSPKGCVCKLPYIGLDCSSQVIAVPPIINGTIPQTNLTVVGDKKEVFYAIISVVGLNELDSNNIIVNRYSFDQWVVSSNTQSRYQQYTNSVGYIYTTSLANNNDKSITNLNVSIDYFNINDAINITFANQQLQMNPHSLKYSINITNYSFKSSLNSLQLVLSASLESNHTNQECSSKQIGDVVDSESEFIKMQIDTYSLYGRFIKRGVIDNRVKYVTNTLLDSEYNAIEETSKEQTYIGINIPFFNELAQLDPDFSIVKDNTPSSYYPNSICHHKPKLNSSQIAGIVIGAIVLVAVGCMTAIYFTCKKRAAKKSLVRREAKVIPLKNTAF